ncbi:MAG: protoporphyrinogen oxidase [Planctomycetota bacterium]|nr:MAG: protoporphyrinogen oxidase [Planctomycetota bacterium]
MAIIGGGISGLAAALELVQAGPEHEVVLLEAQPRLGGVLETVYDGPYLIEKSADNFATMIPHALELCRRIGYADELITPRSTDRRAFVWHRGRPHPIPAGFSLMQPTRVASVLTSGVLSWAGKLRLLGEMWVPPRQLDDADESLESFATRRLGREAYLNLVEPIVSGIFTADPSTLSMQATMPQFLEMERRHGSLIRAHLFAKKNDAAAAARRASGARYDQFVAPRRGMSHWIEYLTAQLPHGVCRTGVRVDAISSPDGRTWKIDTSEGTLEAEGVILATPAHVSARLIEPLDGRAAELLAGIPYASSAVVAMIVRSADLHQRTDGFGMVVPRASGRPTLAISYSSHKYPGRVPDGQVLLRMFFGGATHPEVLDLTDQALLDLAESELRHLLDWRGSSPDWAGVIRWPQAMPQYLVGHRRRIDELTAALSDHPRLQVCGAGYEGVGIPQCIRSAQQAAKRLAQALGLPLPLNTPLIEAAPPPSA